MEMLLFYHGVGIAYECAQCLQHALLLHQLRVDVVSKPQGKQIKRNTMVMQKQTTWRVKIWFLMQHTLFIIYLTILMSPKVEQIKMHKKDQNNVLIQFGHTNSSCLAHIGILFKKQSF